MNLTTCFVNSLAILLFLAAPTWGQGDPGPGDVASAKRQPTSVARKDTRLLYHPVGPNVDIDDLLGAAQAAFGRRFFLDDGSTTLQQRNLFRVGSSIAVLDQKSHAERILAALPDMEKAYVGVQKAQAPGLETRHFRLQHVSVLSFQSVLSVWQESRSGPGRARTKPLRYSVHKDSNTLIARGSEAMLEEIARLIAEVDKPTRSTTSRPITFTCHVVRATHEEVKNRLPDPLTRNLAKLVGHDGFEELGTAVIRSRSDASEVSAKVQLAQGMYSMIRMSALNLHGQELEIGGISFSIGSLERGPRNIEQEVQTSTAVTLGEYTVIGAFGTTPVFLVIRAAGPEVK